MSNLKDLSLDRSDILELCSSSIHIFFAGFSVNTPPVQLLVQEAGFRYCSTDKKKLKGKVGYTVKWYDIDFAGASYPSFSITINSFKHGGLTETYSANNEVYAYLKGERQKDFNIESVIARKIEQAKLAKQQQRLDSIEAKKKEKALAKTATDYKHAKSTSDDFTNHPYVFAKNLLINPDMFSITRDSRLILPIINLNDYSISGYQTIETNGFKRVQGKVNGAIIYSGSHFLDNNYISESNESPSSIYIAEGFATAGSVADITSKVDDKLVLSAVSANNLVNVSKNIADRFPNAKIYICADNDNKTYLDGKGNAGLKKAYEAARIVGKNATVIFPEGDGNIDWNDLMNIDYDLALTQFKDNRVSYRSSDRALFLERELIYSPKLSSEPALHKVNSKLMQAMFRDVPCKLMPRDVINRINQINTPFKSYRKKTINELSSRMWNAKQKKSCRAITINIGENEQKGLVVVRDDSIESARDKIMNMIKESNRPYSDT